METKVQLKNIYLIAVITIGLIGLGVGSTFAMFTAEANIKNPISFTSNLDSSSLLMETKEIIIPGNSDKYVDLVISNTSNDSLNYSVWYMTSYDNIKVGCFSDDDYTAVGKVASSGNFTLTVQIRNGNDSPARVVVGISSSKDDIILPPNAELITLDKLSLTGYVNVGHPVIDLNNRMSVSEGNFIKSPFVFDNDGKNWELRLKTYLPSSENDYEILSFVDEANDYVKGMSLKLDSLNNLLLLVSSSYDNDIGNGITLNINDLINNDVYIKFGWNGSKYYIGVSSDGETWGNTYLNELNSFENIKTGYVIAFGKNINPSSYIYLDSIELDIDNKLYWEAIVK